MILLKDGVRLQRLHPKLWHAACVVAEVLELQKRDCVVTSASDGMHKPNSKHYKFEALDFRTKHLKKPFEAVAEIKRRLGKGYDVIYEKPGLENEHLHIEWDPKEGEI